MRIAHFGTFDVENFGDLLFPHLIEERMPEHDFVHVSPAGGKTWADSLEAVGVAALTTVDIDAVVVGGGNIVSAKPTALPAYAAMARFAYPELWIGAAALAVERNVPLVFNAPGVLDARLSGGRSFLASQVGHAAQLVAFRDRGSRDVFCGRNRYRGDVVPDSALEARTLLSRRFDLSLPWPANGEQTVTVHLKERNVLGDVAGTAAQIDRFAAGRDARAVLIAIGRCHGDNKLAIEVASRMRSDPIILDDPNSIELIVRALKSSVAYAGSSLHGFIVASAFDVPAAIVAGPRPLPKYRGLLEQMDGDSHLFGTWNDLNEDLDREQLRPVGLERALATLDVHWQRVRAAIESSPDHSRLTRAIIPQWRQILTADRRARNGRQKVLRR
jgi:hypothetical protein